MLLESSSRRWLISSEAASNEHKMSSKDKLYGDQQRAAYSVTYG
jgi:hypothetical protein